MDDISVLAFFRGYPSQFKDATYNEYAFAGARLKYVHPIHAGMIDGLPRFWSAACGYSYTVNEIYSSKKEAAKNGYYEISCLIQQIRKKGFPMSTAREIELTNTVPIGQLRAKLKNTIYQLKGGELVRTKNFLEVGDEKVVYRIENAVAYIGNGQFVKDVDPTHFKVTCGLLTIIGNNVHACSRNGIGLRHVREGKTYTVV